MKRGAGIVLCGLLVSGFAVFAPSAHAEIPTGSVGWQYSEAGRGYYQPPKGSPSPSQPPGPNDWVEQVVINQPTYECQGQGIGNCDPLSIWCNPDLTPTERRPIYVRAVERYQWKNRDNKQEWSATADCYPTPEWVPEEEIAWNFKYAIERRLPQPKVELAPYPNTLVNFPTVVYTHDYGELNFPITVPPSQGRSFELHGNIHAVPEYTWTFEGGRTVKGAGKPYEPGKSPNKNPDYYVTNTFTSTGEKNVHLEVRWTGEITVDGLPPQPIQPVTFEADLSINVVESETRLGG